MANQHKNR